MKGPAPLLTAAVLGLFLAACGSARGPQILSWFGDYYFDGKLRTLGVNPHTGWDVAGEVGTPVLAAADGVVVLAGPFSPACGSGVVIDHSVLGTRTMYCHLLDGPPKNEGTRVKRGDVIGFVGRTGTLGISDRSHVHFEVRVGWKPVDPEPYVVGCFDPQKSYLSDRLVLTYPVKC